jgi:hypothetical protein
VFDVINDAVINAHASAMTSDALGSIFQVADAAAVDVEEIPGLQKGGWLGPITDFLEASLGVRVAVLSRTFGAAARPSVPRLGVGDVDASRRISTRTLKPSQKTPIDRPIDHSLLLLRLPPAGDRPRPRGPQRAVLLRLRDPRPHRRRQARHVPAHEEAGGGFHRDAGAPAARQGTSSHVRQRPRASADGDGASV